MFVKLFYRAKLTVSRYIPNKDNLPFTLLSGQLVERQVLRARENVRNRHLVFTISPGRAGSEYLAKLLDSAENVCAFHEPLPRMNGGILELAVNRPLKETYLKRSIKIMGINRALSRMEEKSIYIETSHMFVKSFYDVVLDYYDNVEVIILRRPMHKVLKSFVELGFFSDENPVSSKWMHDPGAANCVAEPLKPVADMDQYERCIAYLLDIEARAQAFNFNFPQIKTHNITLESILETEGAKSLFQELGAQWGDASETLCASVVNSRPVYKLALGRLSTEEYCLERLNQYITQAKNAGKLIPEVAVL